MASETLLICVLMLSSVRVINSAESLFNVKCRPAVGVIGQITHISCSYEDQTGPVIINTVSLTRFSENKPSFTFQPYENRVTGDSRFKVESLPSLQLHNTAISDEGGYKYSIRTNQGNVNVQFTINVTAEYRSPIITSELTVLENSGAADLYCRASGGYPAGTIHWFDKSNSNWTQNSELQITQGHDGLFTLSSKLSFRSIHATWTPFRCVVLNYRYEEGKAVWRDAEYTPPIITSEPTEIENSGAADLYCRASGGYPAGTIHWFDQRNTNWTQNSTLQITPGHDGLFTLSSKLSFRSFDTTWGPFRCIVLNYRYEEEGKSTTTLGRDGHSSQQKNHIMVAIVTSGFLIVLLMIVFFFFKQRLDQQLKKARSMDLPLNFDRDPADIKEKEGLNDRVYNTAGDAEETITV